MHDKLDLSKRGVTQPFFPGRRPSNSRSRTVKTKGHSRCSRSGFRAEKENSRTKRRTNKLEGGSRLPRLVPFLIHSKHVKPSRNWLSAAVDNQESEGETNKMPVTGSQRAAEKNCNFLCKILYLATTHLGSIPSILSFFSGTWTT